jgi:tRNA splicing endonuclease
MKTSKVINVDEHSAQFLKDLARRVRVAKNIKNRIPLATAKRNILAKYRELANAKI